MGVIIAIDGPAGSGKSSVASKVASRLGLARVDTGSIYRAATFRAMELGCSFAEEAELARVCEDIDLELDGHGGVKLHGKDVSSEIRSAAVSEKVSPFSAFPAVRAALLERQRQLGRGHPKGAVLDGRDVGTVVFPDAELKVFLTASAEERARRRFEERKRRGEDADLKAVLSALQERDQRDAERSVAPMKPAEDAILLDTTSLDFDQVVEKIESLFKQRYSGF